MQGTLWLIGLLTLGAEAASDLRLDVAHGDKGQTTYRVENAFYRLTLDPDAGARVAQFSLKPSSFDWVYPGGGFFLDHVWQEPYPGQLLGEKYDVRVLERGPERVVIECSRRLHGKIAPEVEGLVLTRRMTFDRASPAIGVRFTFTSGVAPTRVFGLWVQHCFYAGASRPLQLHFRPTTRGVQTATYLADRPATTPGAQPGEEFIKDPAAGWTATVAPDTGEGAVFLMDYNELRWLYDCLSCWTTEWFCDEVRLRRGKRWTTDVTMIPIRGFRNVLHASPNIIVGADLNTGSDASTLTLTAAAATKPLRDVTIGVELRTGDGGNVLGRARVTFDRLGYTPGSRQVKLVPIRSASQLRLDIRADGVQEGCRLGVHPTRPVGTPGTFQPIVRLARPAKRKVIAKPEAPRRLPHAHPSVLVLEGLFARHYRVADAVRLADPEARIRYSSYGESVYGHKLGYFPADGEEMLYYDVVVIGNVDAESLTERGVALLEYFNERGGGLLFLGGTHGFGKAGFGTGWLDRILPVVTLGPFDLQPARPPLVLRPADRSRAAGCNWSAGPSVLWYHRVGDIRPGAAVTVRMGRRPFLVRWQKGNGRVAAILGTTMGDPGAGVTPFWKWKDWPRLLASEINWLRGKED